MMKKKTLTLIALLCTFVLGAWSQNSQPAQVKYIERSWNASQVKVVDMQKYTTDYEMLQGTEDPEAWALLGSKDDLNDHYYVVAGNVTYKTLNVYGKAHIIFCDGATLTCTGGILVEEQHNKAQLFIYGQTGGTGKLIVTNSYDNAAGIGSSMGQKSGDINIHGGNLDITGGKNAAGIGSGGSDDSQKAAAGLIQIYDGHIKAQGGDYGAGIGGGKNAKGGPLYLYGGEVTAIGGEYAAGVGGGGGTRLEPGGECGTVHVFVCKLTAQGGENGAGIGTGMLSDATYDRGELYVYHPEAVVTATGGKDSAGIGGGRGADGITTHINAGTVTAKGCGDAAGIGGGGWYTSGGLDSWYGYGGNTYINGGTVTVIVGEDCSCRELEGGSAIGSCKKISNKEAQKKAGKLEFGSDMRVTAGDYDYDNSKASIERVFTSDEREPACRWRNYVKIESCSHEKPTVGTDLTAAIFYTYVDEQNHTKYCRYFKYSLQEAHESSTNCVCGLNTYSPLTKDDNGAWLIKSVEDWATFCNNVNYGSHIYSGETVKLTVDISSSTIVGTEKHPFVGTFDGDGHTLTVNISSSDVAAPFGYVGNVTIQNLHVTGSVQTTRNQDADHTSGLIGRAAGTVTIENVRVSTTVKGLTYYGGIIAHGNRNDVSTATTIKMTGCVFDGSLTEKTAGETQYAGGFIGWGGKMNVTMTDCLFDGTYTIGSDGNGKHNFHPVGYASDHSNNVTASLSNVYYSEDPSAQNEVNNGTPISSNGKRMHSISKSYYISTLIISGDAKEYSMSGITGYDTGIKYGSTFYAGSGEIVNLTLAPVSAGQGWFVASYVVIGGGSLDDATSNTPKLTMTDADQTINAKRGIVLADDADNSEAISTNNTYDVMLSGRTLYKDGKWNTLCLPFDVSTTTGPLSGDNVEAMMLHSSDSGLSGTTLTLNFDAATSIPAGTPFIIRWGTPDSHPDTDLTDPVFSDVTINNTTNDVDFTGGAFKGTYKKITYTTENQSILLLGDKDNLYYPQPTGGSNPSIGAFRAYFELNSSASARAFVLNFGEGETTGILSTTNLTNDTNSDAWYDLSGRRLSSKPTQSGLYLNNGRKVVIK